ncbi:hypothetical protein [Micromonospora sediminimaris]|uniref:Uncharacterized protein n=1 Tax=Micromonospora sediminimaris TaxID=547162 RepID=A0A9W5XJV6_9ACTN|nr:hypothetical protein [Micromonospora sediminimaris]GIJ33319.1 hypothetical protein Vse01_24670 [Micromonospora sediminimaris]
MAAGTAAPASGPVVAVAAVRVAREAASAAVRVAREAASAGPEPAARAGGRAAERGLVPAGTDRASAAPVLGRAVPATATVG